MVAAPLTGGGPVWRGRPGFRIPVCDATMNSRTRAADASRRGTGPSYTEEIMTRQGVNGSRLFLCQRGGNSLGQSRVAMAEVQICGIPKLSTQEVAPTP